MFADGARPEQAVSHRDQGNIPSSLAHQANDTQVSISMVWGDVVLLQGLNDPDRNNVDSNVGQFRLQEDCGGVVMYCDLHAHSRKHNMFIYGCENRRTPEKRLHEQVFPLMLHKNSADKVIFTKLFL